MTTNAIKPIDGERLVLMHVNVRLRGLWRTEWRQVYAASMKEAERMGAAMPDVQQVYEVSLIPGGVVT